MQVRDLNRGYTGHEQLDHVGLIHMNGRVYDPIIGRFLSADPNVQFPNSTQGLNRYTYVNNNPLSFTDPSGFFLKKLFKEIRRVVHQIDPVAREADELLIRSETARQVGGLIAGVASAIVGPWVAAAYNAHVTSLLGGSSGDIFRAGAYTLGSAYISAGIGRGVNGLGLQQNVVADLVVRGVAHGAAQGGLTKAQGGEFRSGFYAGAVSSASGAFVNGVNGVGGRVTIAAIAGGVAAELGGGKFANGAVTGAFIQAFNHEDLLGLRESLMDSFGDPQRDAYNQSLEDAGTYGRRQDPIANRNFLKAIGRSIKEFFGIAAGASATDRAASAAERSLKTSMDGTQDDLFKTNALINNIGSVRAASKAIGYAAPIVSLQSGLQYGWDNYSFMPSYPAPALQPRPMAIYDHLLP